MKLPSKILIPSDWDGVTWECFEVQWPNSPEWLSILRGLIGMMMYGRVWDERSGIITQVQQIGYQIEDANIPLTTCDGDTVPSDTITEEVIRYIFAGEGEEDFMGWLCGVNPEAFKIEDGVLSVRNFCGDWVEIGELTPPTDQADPDVWPEEDPPATYYACGKVASLQTAMLALSDAAWDNYNYPDDIEGAMRAAVPQATLSRARIYQWIASLISIAATGGEKSDFNNATANALARCQAVEDVAATAEGTGDERGVVVEAMASAYYNTIGLLTKESWFAYWHFCTETIGDEDSRLILSLGAKDSTANCDCPNEIPPDVTWDYCYDLAADQNGWAEVATNGHWTLGVGLEADTGVGAQGQWQAPDRPGGEYGGVIRWCEVEFTGDNGTVISATFGYAGMIIYDDTYGLRSLIGGDPWWGNGSQNFYSGVISVSYAAEANQRIRIGLRLEDQSTIGFSISRVRIAGTGEPLIAAPTTPYTP